jgi:hypothetical protein
MSEDRIIKGVIDNLQQIDNAINVIINMMTKNELPFSNNLLNPMIEISVTIGLMLVTAYWLIGFVNEITEMDWRHLSIWWYMKKLVVIILGKEIVAGSIVICRGIFQFVNWLVVKYQGSVDIPNMVSQLDVKTFTKMVEDLNLADRLMFNVELQFPKIVLMVVAVIVQMLAYWRCIKIAMLQVFAPIRLATVVNKGCSGAFPFLQDYVGEVAQVIVIIVGLRLYSNIVGDMMLNAGDSSTNMFIKLILASVMLLATIGGAVPFARKLIGGN